MLIVFNASLESLKFLTFYLQISKKLKRAISHNRPLNTLTGHFFSRETLKRLYFADILEIDTISQVKQSFRAARWGGGRGVWKEGRILNQYFIFKTSNYAKERHIENTTNSQYEVKGFGRNHIAITDLQIYRLLLLLKECT